MSTDGPSPLRSASDARSVLLLSFEDEAVGGIVRASAPLAEVTVFTKADLAGRSVGQTVRFLRSRSYDAAVISLHAQTVARSRGMALLLLVGLRARAKFLRCEDGGWETVTWARIATQLLPQVLLTLVGGGLAVALSRFVIWAARGMFVPSVRRSGGLPQHPTVLFIRPDLAGGVKAGGSVSHVKGIIHAFLRRGARVVYLSDAPASTLPEDVEQVIVPPVRWLEMSDELQMIAFNLQILRRSQSIIESISPDLVYQRHALHHLAGGILARRAGAVHVLEVNASEIWIRKEWSRLLFQGHATAAEFAALDLTDRISVISEGVRDQLRSLGVAEERMVVAPNGVDPQEFRPDIDAPSVRERLGWSGGIIVGFIGTYTKWHGVETLRDVILSDDPALQDVRYLLIGDGDLRNAMQKTIEERGSASRCMFTGIVPHAETPRYLAACDILVSPHLGFSGDKPFFGSPTKLFEYMAMGRPIVASAIGQLATILLDDKNALLFKPGDVAGMTEALKRLVADAGLRARLGAAARRDVVAQYTWDANLDRVLGRSTTSSH